VFNDILFDCNRLVSSKWKCTIISEATLIACSLEMHLWTAGQRIDPTTGSRFVWRVITTDERNGIQHSDTVSEMKYTNWQQGQPDNHLNREACMMINSGRSYTWNDLPCSYRRCSLCEI